MTQSKCLFLYQGKECLQHGKAGLLVNGSSGGSSGGRSFEMNFGTIAVKLNVSIDTKFKLCLCNQCKIPLHFHGFLAKTQICITF